MAFPKLRADLDLMLDEWRAHRGAEIALLRGLEQVTRRLGELQTQLDFQGDAIRDLEARSKAHGGVPS
jgi:hypothetical protein